MHGGLSLTVDVLYVNAVIVQPKKPIAEDLVVGGKTVGCVKILCYLGYTLGGANLATTA